MATVLIGFSWNQKFEEIWLRLGLLFHFDVLRHQILVKMTVEKPIKTGSDVNPEKNVNSEWSLPANDHEYVHIDLIWSKTNF